MRGRVSIDNTLRLPSCDVQNADIAIPDELDCLSSDGTKQANILAEYFAGNFGGQGLSARGNP